MGLDRSVSLEFFKLPGFDRPDRPHRPKTTPLILPSWTIRTMNVGNGLLVMGWGDGGL